MKKSRIVSALAIAIVISFSLFCMTSCFGESKEMENARTCMNLGHYDKALTNIEAEIGNNPGNTKAYTLKGRALIRMMEGKKAKESFDTALKIDPSTKDSISSDCIKDAVWFEKKSKKRTYHISVWLLEFAKEIDPQKEEEVKICLEDLGKFAIEDKRLRASIEYLMAREKYGKDKNLEFAKIYYNLPLGNLYKKKEALKYASYFDENYKDAYVKVQGEILQKLVDKAINSHVSSIRGDSTTREIMRSAAQSRGPKKIRLRNGDIKTLKIKAFGISPQIVNQYSLSVKSKNPLYLIRTKKLRGELIKYFDGGTNKIDGWDGFSTSYLLNLSDKDVECTIQKKR